MALIRGFQSTTIWKAFTLNSIVAALIIVVAIYIKSYFDIFTNTKINKGINEDSKENDIISRESSLKGIVVTIFFTFIAAFISYSIMYYLFGFGRAMMVKSEI